MNFENPNTHSLENPEHDKERSRAEGELNFAIQRKLIERSHYSSSDLSSHAMQWIDQLAPKFPPVFEELLIEQPHIVEEWSSMSEGEKDKVIQDLEDKLPPFVEGESQIKVEEKSDHDHGLDMDPFEQAA